MIDQLAKQLISDIQQKASEFSSAEDKGASQLRAIVESALRKLKLVTREEFDAQQAVLMRTRAKLEALESRLEEMVKDHNQRG
ncbi:hypothetical protein SAMN02745866_00818 [Alteromonadaceae bacterium Bs31]|nr:hypothetical protein SAMN02745866_00818 [Alteromonadaceae bacterium Bs31]